MNTSLIIAGGVMSASAGVIIIQGRRSERIGFPLLVGGFVLIIVGFLGGGG